METRSRKNSAVHCCEALAVTWRVPLVPTTRYKFARDSSMEGFLSSNRPSTDALNAVNTWKTGASGRSYAVEVDKDDLLVLDLTWGDTDNLAGADLDGACRRCGVGRSHVPR